MQKKIIYFLLLLILITGCKRNTSGFQPQVIEYHKGTEGLEMNLVTNLPPNEILEGSEFVVGLELKNKGAIDINNGKIFVSGYDIKHIQVTNSEQFFSIEGKQPGFPEGGYDIINFPVKHIGNLIFKKPFRASFRIIVKYWYRTEAGAEVCINPNLHGQIHTKETVCKIEDIILNDGQGAPVAVTKIIEKVAPLENKIKINFKIYIQNKGEGEVKDIFVDEVRLANAPITCSIPKGKLDAKDKKEIVLNCWTETLVSSGAYISPLSIKLSYEYTQNINTITDIIPLIK